MPHALPGIPTPPRLRSTLAWALAGLGLALSLTLVMRLSAVFLPEADPAGLPIAEVTALLAVAGLVYWAAVQLMERWGGPGATALTWVLVLGLGLRLMMFWSTPILEDDHNRYLWDGAVAAAGFSPYDLSPAEVRAGGPAVPPELARLAERAGPLLDRINHPDLSTIYPPLTQFPLALAALIEPFGLNAWRGVLLAVDLLSLYLMWRLLRHWGLPLGSLVIYWWNPLLIKEVYNSAHMEPLLFPFLLAALGLAASGRLVTASGALGLAAGVKLWPLILWPVANRPRWWKPRHLVLAALAGIGLALVVCAPLLLSRLDAEAGLVAYVRRWEMNDALYSLLFRGGLALSGSWQDAHLLARLAAAGLILATTLLAARRGWTEGPDLARRCLWTVAALFMLSPTQYPWYYLWLLPFLALAPSRGLLLLTATLPLYYLRYYYEARGRAAFFDNVLVWVEYAPAWALILWDAWRARARKAA